MRTRSSRVIGGVAAGSIGENVIDRPRFALVC
jgi:ABC-type phosphate/phosphonate transport system permease subunit